MEPDLRRVDPPASLSEVVERFVAAPGVESEQRAVSGEPGVVSLRSTTVYDDTTTAAYRTGEVLSGDPVAESDGAELEDAGENWFVGGQSYTRDPDAATVRRASGDLTSMVLGDHDPGVVDEVGPQLAAMLDGWPGELVSDRELLDGIATHHSRFERSDGDTLDVWVDADGLLRRIDRRTDRSPLVRLEVEFRLLDEAPAIPPLPPDPAD